LCPSFSGREVGDDETNSPSNGTRCTWYCASENTSAGSFKISSRRAATRWHMCIHFRNLNQSLQPTAPSRNTCMFTTAPCRGLSLSRWMPEFIVRVSAVILLGLEVLLFALLFAARSVKALRIIEWSLCANSVLVLLFFGYFAWVFRDPWSIFRGTRPSEGAVALFRFAQGIWRLLLIITGILILSAYVYRVRLVRLRGRGLSLSR
jgi:hypothetical protein